MRRSTVLSLPLQSVFPGLSFVLTRGQQVLKLDLRIMIECYTTSLWPDWCTLQKGDMGKHYPATKRFLVYPM